MHSFDPSRVAIPALALLSLALLAWLGYSLAGQKKTHQIVIAAGSSRGESYILATALGRVVEAHHPGIRIRVRETGGTSENLQLLERGEVQMAAAQADVAVPAPARILATLFEDVLQLLVPAGSPVREFPDLAGKRIALPQRGGQYASFLSVALHFGLNSSNFTFVGSSDSDSDQAFADGRADALFRVRALDNPSIAKLARGGQGVHFIGIGQAAAMRIKYPFFEPAVIPQGAYSGNPPIPDRDLASVAIKRTLLAHRDLDPEVVMMVTAALSQRRQEIADAIPAESAELRPLLASVRPPDTQNGLGAPLHEGAREFYERDKPSFLQQNADYLGLLVTLVVLAGSWLWELKRWIERKQKNYADQYSQRAVGLMNQVKACTTVAELDDYRAQLLAMLTEAVQDLDRDRMSQESFQSFRVVWQIALDVIRERRSAIA